MGKCRTWLFSLPIAVVVVACSGTPAAPEPADEAGKQSVQPAGKASSTESPAAPEKVSPSGSGTFTYTGSMETDRTTHTATVLADGKVLVTGGSGRGEGTGRFSVLSHASAEVYDPATGAWTPTGSMAQARALHTATMLLDGRVLVVGKKGEKTSPEVYDPAQRTWSPAGDTAEARGEHMAVLLDDGRVLIAGGRETRLLQHLASTELYDPGTDAWSVGPDMEDLRAGHTLTRLRDGKVLVVGSDVSLVLLPAAELFDPATDSWLPTSPMAEGRAFQTATLLQDGRVLVAGGQGSSSAEIYDPATETWSSAGNMAAMRAQHAAVLLDDGRALVAGGWPHTGNRTDIRESADLYDPATNTWSSAGGMGEPRYYFTATLLADGSVLVIGGEGKRARASRGDLSRTAEVYQP